MENSQNQNNPSGIWQSMWAELFKTFFYQFGMGNYRDAFTSLKTLKKMIPPDCETDIEEEYEKTFKIFNKRVEAAYGQSAELNKRLQLQREMPEPLLTLAGSIRTSLYQRGWINKNFGAKPRYEHKGHLNVPTQ